MTKRNPLKPRLAWAVVNDTNGIMEIVWAEDIARLRKGQGYRVERVRIVAAKGGRK